jgi:thioredoxin reductase
MMTKNKFDIIIIGGSYAGLSAAMALGRSLRRVLVIDSGLPCNRQAPHSHNFLTQDGENPTAIAAKAKAQVLKYDTISFFDDVAINGAQIKDGFSVTTQTGAIFTARKLIFATGVKDIMPAISGFSACWGVSVIHCPYCHGYEVTGEQTGILANGDIAFHYGRLIKNWTSQLTIFTNGDSTLTTEQNEKIKQNHISIVENEISELAHVDGQLNKILFKDGSSFNLKALYARPAFTQHCPILEMLGCEFTDQGLIKVDGFQKTTVANVFACGDSANPLRAVASAVSSGNLAGAMANNNWLEETF